MQNFYEPIFLALEAKKVKSNLPVKPDTNSKTEVEDANKLLTGNPIDIIKLIIKDEKQYKAKIESLTKAIADITDEKKKKDYTGKILVAMSQHSKDLKDMEEEGLMQPKAITALKKHISDLKDLLEKSKK